jgi:threonine dehydrogenase-like Zn-dependent dehydrogenase
VAFAPNWPETKVGGQRDGRTIEWSSTMTALVYFGKEHMEVVDNRPIVCTDQDIIARVDRVHRCGTDVKIFHNGRPDQCEESLFDELKVIMQCSEQSGKVPFTAYADLAMGGVTRADINDPLYQRIAERVAALSDDQRRSLATLMRLHWGRILGHETVVTIERVGSRVHELRKGIGYLDGVELTDEFLNFKPGDRFVLQSRIAYYDPPPSDMPDARGVQLLGGNITDLAMNLGGAYACYTRLTPEIICSGSAIRVPAGVSPEAASLAEPTACLLDCFQKSTHEVGQDATGSILVKGARPGGVTCVIGSGSMALMAGQLATLDDPIVRMGIAREVVFVVRSRTKADLVRSILEDRPVSTVICVDEARLSAAIAEQYAPSYKARFGRDFPGFDDVIIAAGGAQTVGDVHKLITHTGGRLQAFAGTRGPCTVESGVWHYGNAAIIGTSGCNTKMMEVVLGLFARGSLQPEPLAGKVYTFDDLRRPGGISAFFDDKNLRPCLAPNR